MADRKKKSQIGKVGINKWRIGKTQHKFCFSERKVFHPSRDGRGEMDSFRESKVEKNRLSIVYNQVGRIALPIRSINQTLPRLPLIFFNRACIRGSKIDLMDGLI